MAKMYAWSTFRTEVNEWGQVLKTIAPGEEVTQAALKVSDEEWEYLIESGAVSEEPYPDIPADVAPAEHYANQAAALARNELSGDEAQEVQERQMALVHDEETLAANSGQPEKAKAGTATTNK